jgi:hypothetical protein
MTQAEWRCFALECGGSTPLSFFAFIGVALECGGSTPLSFFAYFDVALECGGSTPLSFFAFPERRAGLRENKEKAKKESGVEPPHSKATPHFPGRSTTLVP